MSESKHTALAPHGVPPTDDGAARPGLVGWREWVGLPAAHTPWIKAKIDTGARTSSLHAFDIEPFGPANAPRVRFAIHPIPGREDLVIPCSAKIVDRREVISSNGDMEYRFVIRSDIAIGDQSGAVGRRAVTVYPLAYNRDGTIRPIVQDDRKASTQSVRGQR